MVQWLPDLEEKLRDEGLLVESEAERIRKLPKAARTKALKQAAQIASGVYRDNADLLKSDSLTGEFWDCELSCDEIQKKL